MRYLPVSGKKRYFCAFCDFRVHYIRLESGILNESTVFYFRRAALKKNIVKIDAEKCKECGLCIVECRPKILSFSDEINSQGFHPVRVAEPDKCTGCTMCAIACPEAIIEITREED